MINLLRLIARRWLVAWRIHLATLLISAAVLSGWLLFWGYAEAVNQVAAARVIMPQMPADLILLAALDDEAIEHVPFSRKVYSYRPMTVGTAYGQHSLGAIDGYYPNAGLPQPAAGQIWLAEGLARHWHLSVGDSFSFRVRQGFEFRNISAEIGGTYDDSPFLPDLLVEGVWFGLQRVELPARVQAFYDRIPDINVSAGQQYDIWLQRLPASVTQVDGSWYVDRAREVVNSTFSSGSTAVGLLSLFMILGVGTFSLLSYLDARRELAVLKSLGLRPMEAWGLFWLESLGAAGLGFILAVVTVNILIRCFSLQVVLTAAIYRRSLRGLVVAVLLATAVPCWFGRTASVVELMLNRPVPLFRSLIQDLSRPFPWMEQRLAAGYRCIRLPVLDGRFPGICLRQVGQSVKTGETVAWESYAFGMGERHYLAPCDGKVVECDLDRGLMVIWPSASSQ